MKKKSSLCPGFRFHPTDIELVMYYLKRKLLGKRIVPEVIADVNIYDFSPWDLSDKSNLRNGDLEWFFFCPKSRKYSSGSRMNRATEAGYWKATGKDREIKYKEKTVALIKTLVFHLGHPPKGERTDWVMHEYRMEDKDLADAGVVQEAYVLCRLFEKSGAGPKNGAQYGAPFEEEDWDDDDDEVNLSGATIETMFLKGSSSTLTNMTLADPGPSTATSIENKRNLDQFTAPSAVFGPTETLVPYASSSVVTNVTTTEPGQSIATLSENARHFEKSTVTSSAVFDPCGATNGLFSYASGSAVMNLTSTEQGPSTKTLVPYASSSAVINETSMEPGPSNKTLVPYASSSENARHHLGKDDPMLTHADVASILHNNNTQDLEADRKGKKIMTDAPNDDEMIFLDSSDWFTLDDLIEDGFSMHGDAEFDELLDQFLVDDLGKFI